MNKILLRLGDFVFVMRPLIMIPAWSFFLLGAAAARRLTGLQRTPTGLYYGLACLTAILATSYLLNQVFDRESDRRNRKGHYLTRGIFKVRSVVAIAVVAFMFASYFFRFATAAQRVPLVLALVLSLVYSVPPLRLVSRPFADLLANAIGYGGIAFIAGYASYDAPTVDAVLLAVPYVLLVGATFLHTTILDVDGDVASGKITTTVAIGPRRSAALSGVFAGAGCLPAAFVSYGRYGDIVSPAIMAVGFALFAASAVKVYRAPDASPGPSSASVQAATALITLPAAVLWPAYFVLLVPVVVAARLYYKARFGLDYPGPG